MTTFEINGKDYELKLNFKAVKYLNGLHQGGAYELIAKAIMGDLETFVHIVYAGLFHTDEKFTLKTVDKAIENLFEEEKLDQDVITRICNDVVTASFFYKPTLEKLLKDNPEAKKALEQLTS